MVYLKNFFYERCKFWINLSEIFEGHIAKKVRHIINTNAKTLKCLKSAHKDFKTEILANLIIENICFP